MPDDESKSPELDAQLAQLQNERDELRERLLRTAAELDNTLKRNRRNAAASELEVRANLLRAFLPVADNLERALEHAVEQDPVALGVKLVHRQLMDLFERQGVTRFFPIGEPFDPSREEAIDELETVEMPPGTVANVLQPGYLLGDRVLRAAIVTVSKRPSEATSAEEQRDR